jgi:hypothetical protein
MVSGRTETCPHGIRPKKNCKICRNEYALKRYYGIRAGTIKPKKRVIKKVDDKRKCQYCKNWFKPHHSRQIYCSKVCYAKALVERQKNKRKKKICTRVCSWCHEPFEIKYATNSRFCTSGCNNKLCRMKSKILTFFMDKGYSFNSNKIASEISRLYREGKDYKITK